MLTIQQELRDLASSAYSEKVKRFFKTQPGEYAYGDRFLGVRTPDVRKLALKNVNLSVADNRVLIGSQFHEERLCGLIILVYKYNNTQSDKIKQSLYNFYVSNFDHINNWDLVDVSCPYIIGKHLLNRDRSDLYHWVKSNNLWVRRISIVSNWWFIRNQDLSEVFKLAKLLINDKEDLIHKAVGWMLRESGKKNQIKLQQFLNEFSGQMPRTMLRYSIEKLPSKLRESYLK